MYMHCVYYMYLCVYLNIMYVYIYCIYVWYIVYYSYIIYVSKYLYIYCTSFGSVVVSLCSCCVWDDDVVALSCVGSCG